MHREGDIITFTDLEQYAVGAPSSVNARHAPAVFNNILAGIQKDSQYLHFMYALPMKDTPEAEVEAWKFSYAFRAAILEDMKSNLGKLAADEIRADTTFKHGDKLDQE